MKTVVAAMLMLIPAVTEAQVEVVLSTSSLDNKLTPQDSIEWVDAPAKGIDVIEVDPDTTYQSIVGIGSSLEHATCYNLSLLSAEERRKVLVNLLDPEEGIGMDMMRICIGTSDFAGEPWYTYDDMPAGEEDPDLSEFSIEKDRDYYLPTLKLAREINPDLRYVASPWSPPAWMKTNKQIPAGRFDSDYSGVYARYLLKYLEAYEAEGLPIYAMTLQNEPGYPNPDYPTCFWRPEQQRDFIRDHVGPLFTENDVDTVIWCWDHNYDYLKFPRTVLSDPEAAKYVDGTGFHFYEGEAAAMSELKEEFPEKDIYFTEGSTFGVRGAMTIMDIFRNWSRCYLAWVTMLDQDRKPNNGPHHASPTAIMLNTEDMTVEYRFDFYMYGQFSKFIDRGATRIASTAGDERFHNVAFANPDGELVVVVANGDRRDKEFAIACNGQFAPVVLPPFSVATITWRD